MEILKILVGYLVIIAGLGGGFVFLPQIKLLLKTKDSGSLSLGMLFGSVAIQSILILHGILQKDYYLLAGIGLSLTFLLITTGLAIRYRKRTELQKAGLDPGKL